MTDPKVTSDDILSSIRRLVADEERLGAGAKLPAHDKLVLSPNLRVVTSTSRAHPKEALQTLHLQAPPRAGLTIPQFVSTVAQGIDPQAMDWEPETDAVASDMDDWDMARPNQSAPTAPVVEPTIPNDLPNDGQKPAVDLPTEALRDLVRDLVREQFQGDLGLHITRSIRKLVKSEIAREIALREMN